MSSLTTKLACKFTYLHILHILHILIIYSFLDSLKGTE